ncbi:hypothetical protein [Haliangium sp.]|uniref:hypothetical protein n=1 Tax=Haliangium sp. TaxID=2663208 RepID=UPI003D09E9AF
MIRWFRAVLLSAAALVALAAGSLVGLLLVANSGYVEVKIHSWLRPAVDPLLAYRAVEVQMPVLLAGWLIAVLALTALVVCGMLYLWRWRQYEGLIERLEHELVTLRNLPLNEPAPLEDLPEQPDRATGAALDSAMAEIFGSGQRRGGDGEAAWAGGDEPGPGRAASRRSEAS